MKYLVGAVMMTVLSCSAVHAEEKPYTQYGGGKNVLMEKCLEAYDKGYTLRSNNGDNSYTEKGTTYGPTKLWSDHYFLLEDRVYRLIFYVGKKKENRRITCMEYSTYEYQ